MLEAPAHTSVYDSINDVLNGTKWHIMRPGSPKKIKMPQSNHPPIDDIMNYYRSAGWIVRASLLIETDKRTYTLEFVNPYHK